MVASNVIGLNRAQLPDCYPRQVIGKTHALLDCSDSPFRVSWSLYVQVEDREVQQIGLYISKTLLFALQLVGRICTNDCISICFILRFAHLLASHSMILCCIVTVLL